LDTCDDPEALSSLLYVNLGGEIIYPTTLVQARKLAPNAAMGNVYGPTEASVFNSSWPCNQHDGSSFVPLGGYAACKSYICL
jgi:non-ribosomal peptide synthetase component F